MGSPLLAGCDYASMRMTPATLTISLLAGLITINTFDAGGVIALDARLVALVAAIIALILWAPFLVVVVIGAVAAAVARLLGMP